MEAETYLSTGYGLRLAIESRPSGWKHFQKLAKTTMPGRLKGIQVSPTHGTPFLAATQIFDLRPVPRKWLALARTADKEARFVQPGDILITRSGTVGRTTIATNVHRNVLISDDLLRVEPIDDKLKGWVYAYLLSEQTRAIMTGSHYGQIIKHLEPEHVGVLPIPEVSDQVAAEFSDMAAAVLNHRNESTRLALQAESLLLESLGEPPVAGNKAIGFTAKASALGARRRRFDASNHAPQATLIRLHLASRKGEITTLNEAGYSVWVPGRYKRIPLKKGVIYRDSADLLEVSPDLRKRFADCDFGDDHRGRVKGGWILIPSSGQVYGIIGTAILATDALEDQVVSNHVIRIAPKTNPAVDVGYLVTYLSHPNFGRPLLKSLAFGSSVPEIDLADVLTLPIPRSHPSVEAKISAYAKGSASARASADIIEQSMARKASAIIDEFIHRPAVRLVQDAPQDATPEFVSLAERWHSERPRGANIHKMINTPAYQAIIAMGERATRPILNALREKPEHWFSALHKITGANPVPPSAEGNLKRMAEAWLKWGAEQGYLRELD